MTVNLRKLPKIYCSYHAKALSPEETRGMIQHIRPRNIAAKLSSEALKVLQNQLVKLDALIAKNPDNINLREYRAYITSLLK